MAYFTPDIVEFFKELSINNNKEWFDVNRKRYEKSVKEPFKKFVTDLILAVQKDDVHVTMEAKDAIFRINRDIRFSKDKTPYKTQVSAIVSSGTKKDHLTPGLYIELSPLDFRIYGGLYSLDTASIAKVREEITYNLDEFQKLISDKSFVSHFGEIQGEKNIRIPKEFEEAFEQQPLIANKQFYYFAKLPIKTIYQPNLIDTIMDYYYAGRPLKEFLGRNLA